MFKFKIQRILALPLRASIVKHQLRSVKRIKEGFIPLLRAQSDD